MNWLKSDLNCYQVVLPADTEPELVAQFADFWRLYCHDVLSTNFGKQWDHLLISMRGVDGRVGIYQQLMDAESPVVAWSSVGIPWWEMIIYEMPTPDDPADLTFENASNEQDDRFARLIVEAAQQAGLAKLAGREKSGIRLRFHRYDNRDPFMDVVIH